MNIVQLILAETGTYDQMMLRPYEALDPIRGIKTLQEVTRFGQNVSPEALSGSVGNILRPAANHMGKIDIVNGWGTKRYRFNMHVVDTDLVGNQTEQYLTGYTDYDGGSFVSGAIDPNLRMYVTSTIRMKSLNYMTDFGRVTQSTIGSSSHVFNTQFYPGMENVRETSTNLQRPMDVFASLQTKNWRRRSANLLDPRTTFAHENVKLSNRNNAMAPTYLSKILKAGGTAYVNAEVDDPSEKTWGRAEGMVKDQAYSQDDALFELHRMTSFQEGDSFTFRELENLCPHLQSVTRLVPAQIMGRMQQQQNSSLPMLDTYQAGTNDGWGGQDIYTVWASILSNSIPPLMLECMISNVGFVLHNHTINGEVDIKWGYVQPFARNLDPATSRNLVDNFGFRLTTQVIQDLLGGNPTSFSIIGHFDVLGESRLEIAIGNNVPVPFATPTFADALFTPVLTRGQSRVCELADTVEFITENLMQSDAGFGAQHQTVKTSPIIMSTGSNYHATSETL